MRLCALLLLAGCAETPKGTWDRMREAGCEGDYVAFFQHVDKSRITENALKTSDGEPAALTKAMAPGLAAQAFTAWEDEVKRGEAGAVCGWVFVDSVDNCVRWNTVSGEAKIGCFEKSGKRWLLTSIESAR